MLWDTGTVFFVGCVGQFGFLSYLYRTDVMCWCHLSALRSHICISLGNVCVEVCWIVLVRDELVINPCSLGFPPEAGCKRLIRCVWRSSTCGLRSEQTEFWLALFVSSRAHLSVLAVRDSITPQSCFCLVSNTNTGDFLWGIFEKMAKFQWCVAVAKSTFMLWRVCCGGQIRIRKIICEQLRRKIKANTMDQDI